MYTINNFYVYILKNRLLFTFYHYIDIEFLRVLDYFILLTVNNLLTIAINWKS